jgi:hypothetical protein
VVLSPSFNYGLSIYGSLKTIQVKGNKARQGRIVSDRHGYPLVSFKGKSPYGRFLFILQVPRFVKFHQGKKHCSLLVS